MELDGDENDTIALLRTHGGRVSSSNDPPSSNASQSVILLNLAQGMYETP